MNIVQLQRMRAAALGGDDKARSLPRPAGGDDAGCDDKARSLPRPAGGDDAGSVGFADALTEAVNRVDGAQKEAEGQINAFVAGEQENLHEVMISMNQAELYLQLMTEVRNKMLDTYQELMRMQV